MEYQAAVRNNIVVWARRMGVELDVDLHTSCAIRAFKGSVRMAPIAMVLRAKLDTTAEFPKEVRSSIALIAAHAIAEIAYGNTKGGHVATYCTRACVNISKRWPELKLADMTLFYLEHDALIEQLVTEAITARTKEYEARNSRGVNALAQMVVRKAAGY